MRRGGLGWRLGVAFAGVAAATALLSVAILAIVWQRQFEAYVHEGLRGSASQLSASMSSYYELSGDWSSIPSRDLVRYGSMTGLRVQVVDANDALLVDSALPTTGGVKTVPEVTGPSEESPVVTSGKVVGFVRLSSPKGVLLSDRDEAFTRSSLIGMLIASLIAVLTATAAGVMYSRLIIRPIDRVTQTAAALRAGDRAARTGMEGPDPMGVLGHTLDEMADAVEADRQFERRLTADVAHELRTPLQAIQATVEAMQDGILPADQQYLGVVRDETLRLSRLAESILDFARLERGSAPFKTEPIDLATPVRAALDTHRALIEASGLTLTEDVATGAIIDGDADRLMQAIGNLLSNGARYTPEGGTVSVQVRSDADNGIIEVTDTGIGIADEERQHVFTRFWRSASARESSAGGLGIGLAVVREIVERHGGTVSVADHSGSGAKFVIEIPLHREEPTATRIAERLLRPTNGLAAGTARGYRVEDL